MLQLLKNYITIEQYAELKGISPWYTRKLCRIGKIKADKFGKVWFINRKEL
jgi:hypothetical protein